LKSASLQYANALADVALQQGSVAAAAKQLGDFVAAYKLSAELRNALASPAVKREEKHAIVEKISERLGAGKILRNFLYTVIDHQRTHLLPEMAETFQEVIRQRQGIAEAEISSAVELSVAQKKQLSQTLERITGKKIESRFTLNPALLGGAVVRIGSTIYDGSLRSGLNALRARLAAE
jgi:F-type H+-transporting ATPase subunit delta